MVPFADGKHGVHRGAEERLDHLASGEARIYFAFAHSRDHSSQNERYRNSLLFGKLFFLNAKIVEPHLLDGILHNLVKIGRTAHDEKACIAGIIAKQRMIEKKRQG